MKTKITKDMPFDQAYKLFCAEAKKGMENSTRKNEKMKVGDIAQQGDVYIFRVADDHPHGPKTNNRQLAEGSTQGSRHIAEGTGEIYLPTVPPPNAKPGALLGPVVIEKKAWTLTHPEHPHHEFGAGTFAIVHQMDAITRQRVAD